MCTIDEMKIENESTTPRNKGLWTSISAVIVVVVVVALRLIINKIGGKRPKYFDPILPFEAKHKAGLYYKLS